MRISLCGAVNAWSPLKTLFTMTPLGEVLELEPRPETGRELLQEVGMDTTVFEFVGSERAHSNTTELEAAQRRCSS